MKGRVRGLISVFLCVVVAACASSSTGGLGKTRMRPPELLTRTRPDLVPVGVTANSTRPSLVVEIQVLVKADGTADMTTLDLSGPGAEANRSSVTAWLQTAHFKPGTENGQPVSALFTMPITAMARTVRVR